MTALYVPPTGETDQKKQNQSLQLLGGLLTTSISKLAKFILVTDYGAVGDGVADDTVAIAAAWTAASAMSPIPALVFPAGIYKASSFPNFAANHARIIPSGIVRLRYTGVSDAVFIDGGAAGGGVNDMTFGPFLIEAPTTALNGLRIRSVHHSYIDVNVRGAGSASAGVKVEWCVCTEFKVRCTVNEDGGWYSAVKPLYGILIDRRGAGSDFTSYCLFTNPVIEGPTNGIYMLNSLGNTVVGGTSEGCTTGITFDTPSLENKAIGTDFEANTADDAVMAGTRNTLINCDTLKRITFPSGAAWCRIDGGVHEQITVAAGANDSLVQNLVFNRLNDAATLSDAGTRTLLRDCRNSGLTAVTGKVVTDLIFTGNAGATTLAAATTKFLANALDATESNVYLVTPMAGTFKNLFVYSGGAPGAAQTYTFTFRAALADTSIVATISGAGSNSASDTTHTATAAAGDRWSIKVVSSAAAAVASQLTWAVEFDPS